ncbi:unnamed protein product [Gordionus sp. m RMFG-2023]
MDANIDADYERFNKKVIKFQTAKSNYLNSFNTYACSENIRMPLAKNIFPILPTLPTFYPQLSLESIIDQFSKCLKPKLDYFICKITEISFKGVNCQIFFQIGPYVFSDVSMFSIKAICPIDFIPKDDLKKIQKLPTDGSNLVKVILKEIIYIPVNENDKNVEESTKYQPIFIMSMLLNDVHSDPTQILYYSKKIKDESNIGYHFLGPMTNSEINFYYNLFETNEHEINLKSKRFHFDRQIVERGDQNSATESSESKDQENSPSKGQNVVEDTGDSRMEGDAKSYKELLENHPSFSNLNCLRNMIQLVTNQLGARHFNVYNNHLTFFDSFNKISIPEDCQNFSAILKQRQAKSWALEILKKGIECFNQSSNLEANQCYNKALSIDPSNVDALVAKGALYASVPNPCLDKAISFFDQALHNEPNHKNAKQYLVQTLLTRGKMLEKEYVDNDVIPSPSNKKCRYKDAPKRVHQDSVDDETDEVDPFRFLDYYEKAFCHLNAESVGESEQGSLEWLRLKLKSYSHLRARATKRNEGPEGNEKGKLNRSQSSASSDTSSQSSSSDSSHSSSDGSTSNSNNVSYAVEKNKITERHLDNGPRASERKIKLDSYSDISSSSSFDEPSTIPERGSKSKEDDGKKLTETDPSKKFPSPSDDSDPFKLTPDDSEKQLISTDKTSLPTDIAISRANKIKGSF